MSHFLDRLTFFRRTPESYSDGHGITTSEDRRWEDGYRSGGGDSVCGGGFLYAPYYGFGELFACWEPACFWRNDISFA